MRGPGRRTLDWVRGATDRGAGEVVLNCMLRDGMREGYDLEHISAVLAATTAPVIASGGAGGREHLRHVLRQAGASDRKSAVAGSRVTVRVYLCGATITNNRQTNILHSSSSNYLYF